VIVRLQFTKAAPEATPTSSDCTPLAVLYPNPRGMQFKVVDHGCYCLNRQIEMVVGK